MFVIAENTYFMAIGTNLPQSKWCH